MNFAAVQHMAHDSFCYALNNDELCISIKTDFDVDKVVLIYGDPFSGGIMGGDWKWNGHPVEMSEKKQLQYHFLWTAIVKPEFKRCKYYFELYSNNEKYIFLEDGFYTEEEFLKLKGTIMCFMFPWMNSIDINTVPQWPQKTVWYQIFPDRFCNGNPECNSEKVIPWKGPTECVSYKDEFGGDLQGIISKLDYLRDLGITGIYLNPINLATTNHKYDTIDYAVIDPHFGDAKIMRNLSDEAHKRGIAIMLDGVFNHSGWLFKPWVDVKKKGPKSKYYNWFMINKWPFDKGWGNAEKGNFYSFAFVDAMPKLNTNNPEVQKYFIDICEKWVTEYDIDAIRLDVANETSHDFCKNLHKRMRQLKSDFYLIGEIWHDATPWLNGDELDSVMNYPLQDVVTKFWINENFTSIDLMNKINRCFSLYMKQSNSVLFNLLDSHDTIRMITQTNDRNKTLQQFVFLFCMTGSVCIYYGTEVLLEGKHDPDCRRCMPWKEIENHEYDQTINFFKHLISLRKNEDALISGNIEFIHDEKHPRLIHIIKTSEENNEVIEAIFNCEDTNIIVNCSNQILCANLFADNTLSPNGFVLAKK